MVRTGEVDTFARYDRALEGISCAAASADGSSVSVINVRHVWTSEVIIRWVDRAMIMAAMCKTNSGMQDRPRKESMCNVGYRQANRD